MDEAPIVARAVPALAAHAATAAARMKPQELSNCLWASAQLQQHVPEATVPAQALATCMTYAAHKMKEQELINSLWAATCLSHAVPEVLVAVPAIAQHLPGKAIGMVSQNKEATGDRT